MKTNYETLVDLVICGEKEGKPRHEMILDVGLTPAILVGLGFDALTYELKAGSPIIIPIARDRQVGRGPLVNEVVSMYAKTGPDPTRRWRDQGLLLWERGRRK